MRRFLRAELATSFSKLQPAAFYCQKRRLVTILMSYRLPWHACGRREAMFTRDKHARQARRFIGKPACTVGATLAAPPGGALAGSPLVTHDARLRRSLAYLLVDPVADSERRDALAE